MSSSQSHRGNIIRQFHSTQLPSLCCRQGVVGLSGAQSYVLPQDYQIILIFNCRLFQVLTFYSLISMFWGRDLTMNVERVRQCHQDVICLSVRLVLLSRKISLHWGDKESKTCICIAETCSFSFAHLLPLVSSFVLSFTLNIHTPRRHELFLSFPFFHGWWPDITLRRRPTVTEHKHCHLYLAQAEK